MQTLLKKIDFGNEAGDDVDLEELNSYFVEQEMFVPFRDAKKKILVATAKKGVGKSALLQWLGYSIAGADPDALVIKCRGADLARTKFKLTSELTTPSDHIRDWMVRICALINRNIAARINLAITDDAITLVETAELDGYKTRNLVGCLLDRFTRFLDKANPVKIPAKDEVELLKRVKNRRVWILIDDLDATFQNTNVECLDLSTFFSACRYLVQDMQDVCFRVTMRTDVWPIVRRYDESLDKMEQYVHDIVWEQSDFLKLLYKRIKTQIDILGVVVPKPPAYSQEEEREEYLLGMAFVPKMPWGDQNAYTYRVIYTLSYHRPRWAIQLCKLAQKYALKSGAVLISKEHIDGVWGEYGKKRISDLVSEHKHQCPNIEELINGFRGCERRMTREKLFLWINNHIIEHISTTIEGRTVTSSIQVAQFLYRLGFIVARSEEPDESYEHYNFDEMPDFLTSRTNEDFGVSWEIHPCYREALDIEKVNWSQRIKKGLKPKHKFQRLPLTPSSLLPPITGQSTSKTGVTLDSKNVLKTSFTVKQLADILQQKPHQILSDLMSIGIFLNTDASVEKNTAEKIAEKYGVKL
jgi:hypothetical protein